MGIFIQSLLRHLLTAAGAVAVSKYGVDEASMGSVVGGVSTAAGLAWSFYEKRKRE